MASPDPKLLQRSRSASSRVAETPAPVARAIFLASTDIGGVEIRIGRLFCELYHRDPMVYLVTHRGLRDRLQKAGIPLQGCQDRVLLLDGEREEELRGFLRRKLIYLRWMVQAWRWTRRYHFQSVYLACTWITVGAPLLVWPGVKTIIAYTIPFLRSNSITWYNRLLLALELNLCDRIDALHRRNDLRRIVLNRRKISLSPNSFTDLSAFAPAPEKLPWVVWAGHLTDYKRPLFFVEGVAKAMAQLGPQGHMWQFHILGDGPERREVQRRIDELELGEKVRVWGYVANVAEFVSRSLIFACTERDTNYPSQSLLEAMASENAIIATDVGDTRLLINEGNGILVKDTTELADTLLRLMEDADLRTRLGKQARDTVQREHTVEAFIRHLESLWDVVAQ